MRGGNCRRKADCLHLLRKIVHVSDYDRSVKKKKKEAKNVSIKFRQSSEVRKSDGLVFQSNNALVSLLPTNRLYECGCQNEILDVELKAVNVIIIMQQQKNKKATIENAFSGCCRCRAGDGVM
jgi:hypothetical protein